MSVLKGWKEICAYARYSKYTLRDWVKHKGFPVLLGRGVRPPISSKNLIDNWFLSQIVSQSKKNDKMQNT